MTRRTILIAILCAAGAAAAWGQSVSPGPTGRRPDVQPPRAADRPGTLVGAEPASLRDEVARLKVENETLRRELSRLGGNTPLTTTTTTSPSTAPVRAEPAKPRELAVLVGMTIAEVETAWGGKVNLVSHSEEKQVYRFVPPAKPEETKVVFMLTVRDGRIAALAVLLG